MSAIIQLLPESTANQIAAGEVVQRPASVVKELLENAVDAGADHIKLFIKNGGCTFIQVEDNGSGMSPMDARMCWERHATSKIKRAEDLYGLHTLGFRGEALASIASVSDVEMKTKTEGDEMGNYIELKAGVVQEQEVVASSRGTTITVKNLFYNIPARKNFLKSITVETKHIFEEFQRIALAYPEIGFEFYNQDKLVTKLSKADLQFRVSELFNYKKDDLILCEEDTDIVKITGFVGSTKLAKRSRGDQYLFANGRFIKDPYLNHAISGAYQSLLEEKQYPFYVLFLEVDPAKIDVNIHPTKHEVKFEDGKHMYSMIQSVVKKALAKHYVIPTQQHIPSFSRTREKTPSSFKTTAPNTRFNPFGQTKERVRTDWEKLDELLKSDLPQQPTQQQFFDELVREHIEVGHVFQLAEKYIVFEHAEELWVAHQYRAHLQVVYERYKFNTAGRSSTQQLLFPRTLELTAGDHQLVMDLKEEITHLGFDLSEFGNNTVIINGLPSELSKEDGAEVLKQIIADYKEDLQGLKSDKKEALMLATARNAAIKAGKKLGESEMRSLIIDLLHCKQNNVTPYGATILVKFDEDSLERFFQ